MKRTRPGVEIDMRLIEEEREPLLKWLYYVRMVNESKSVEVFVF